MYSIYPFYSLPTWIWHLCLQDILYGDQSKTYWVDDTVDPKEFDEDELAEEKARRGQYSVIAKLFECVPEAREAKAHLDKIIDLCGEPATGGRFKDLSKLFQDRFTFIHTFQALAFRTCVSVSFGHSRSTTLSPRRRGPFGNRCQKTLSSDTTTWSASRPIAKSMHREASQVNSQSCWKHLCS